MDEARQAYEEALTIHRELAKTKPETYLTNVAITLNDLGILHADQNRMDEARQAFEEALQIYEMLCQEDPDRFAQAMLPAFNSYWRNWSVDNHEKSRLSVAVEPCHPTSGAPGRSRCTIGKARSTPWTTPYRRASKQAGTAPPAHLSFGSRATTPGDEKRCFHALERAQRYKDTKVQANWWLRSCASGRGARRRRRIRACKSSGNPPHPPAVTGPVLSGLGLREIRADCAA